MMSYPLAESQGSGSGSSGGEGGGCGGLTTIMAQGQEGAASYCSSLGAAGSGGLPQVPDNAPPIEVSDGPKERKKLTPAS